MLGVLAAIEGWAPFDAYPRIDMAGAAALAPAAALALCALAPFADRRGVER